MLYVVALSENKCVTHDGDMDMGVFNFGVERFLEMCGVECMEVYWRPDPKGNRYKRVNFQRHERVAGKSVLEAQQNQSHSGSTKSGAEAEFDYVTSQADP